MAVHYHKLPRLAPSPARARNIYNLSRPRRRVVNDGPTHISASSSITPSTAIAPASTLIAESSTSHAQTSLSSGRHDELESRKFGLSRLDGQWFTYITVFKGRPYLNIKRFSDSQNPKTDVSIHGACLQSRVISELCSSLNNLKITLNEVNTELNTF